MSQQLKQGWSMKVRSAFLEVTVNMVFFSCTEYKILGQVFCLMFHSSLMPDLPVVQGGTQSQTGFIGRTGCLAIGQSGR